MSQLEKYDDFMADVLSQLVQNRENHEASESQDTNFMFQVGTEQLGQLGKALSDGDMARALKESLHVTAIMFEIYERTKSNEGTNSY